MKTVKNLGIALVVGVVISCSPSLRADVIPLGDSGWNIAWAGDDIEVSVQNVDPSSVTIDIVKYLRAQTFGQLPDATVTFVQTDPLAVGTIIVASETVRNDTGQYWGGFRWILTPTVKASFDEAASDWNAAPFTQIEWHPHIVVAGAGTVGIDPFTPGGSPGLVIDVNTQSGSTVFSLRQVALPSGPIPEPTTLALLALSGGILFRKARRSHNRLFSRQGGRK